MSNDQASLIDIKASFHGPLLYSLKKEFERERRDWMEENITAKGLSFDDVKGVFPKKFLSFDNYREEFESAHLERAVEEMEKQLEDHKKALNERRSAIAGAKKRTKAEDVGEAENGGADGPKYKDMDTEVDPDDFPKTDDEPAKSANKVGRAWGVSKKPAAADDPGKSS